ncbi:YdcH family protein [Caulobacter sp. ErkDOM-YI]|uniref:YdcH family protein n=1 Tax=unclassified Caulobacter TaxID=2648921 RepID=UPI003AF6A721
MSNTPHELHEEFPQDADRIHALKTSDAHFAKLVEGYHEVNRAVHRMETNIEAVADAILEDFKKQRLDLKDKIASALAKLA